MKRLLAYALPVLLLNLAAGLNFWHQRRLATLDTQLAQSAVTLSAENKVAAHANADAVKSLQALVEKNRNQPADVARLQRAEAVHIQVTGLLDSLHACAGQVRHAAGQATNVTGRRQPAQPVFDGAYESITRRWHRLRRQVAACAGLLRQADRAAGPPVALPAPVAGTTVVQVLADLAATEYQLLQSEAGVLHSVARAVPYRLAVFEPLPMASAESNVVAPGDVYRARLLLVSHAPADLRMVMNCNGRPVPINSQGIGQVRFRAPLRPGPASWTGTIRFGTYWGRDTTFVVRVPYRVGRR